MTAVCDASPLILLTKLKLFEHLQDIFGQIHMSEDVYKQFADEMTIHLGADGLTKATEAWVKVHRRPPADVIEAYQTSDAISHADAATLALSVTINAPYLLSDDQAFKKIATHYKLRFVGTGALLVHLKTLDIIQSVKHKLDEAQQAGFLIDQATTHLLLAAAQE